MASSRLVDKITYNGADVYPAMMNSSSIKMRLQPMAPYFPAGRLSLTETLRARQSQQGIAHDKVNANNSGNLNSRSTSTHRY